MHKTLLGKTIILGLALSTISGVAWAADPAINVDDGATHDFSTQNITESVPGNYVGGFSGTGSAYRGSIQANNASTVVNITGNAKVDPGAVDIGWCDNFGVIGYNSGLVKVSGNLNVTSDTQTKYDNHGIGLKAKAKVAVGGDAVIDVGDNNGNNNTGIYFRDTDGNYAQFGSLKITADGRSKVYGIMDAYGSTNVVRVYKDFSITIDTDTAGDALGTWFGRLDLQGNTNVDIKQRVDGAWGAVGYRSGILQTSPNTTHTINVTVGKNVYQAHGIEYTNTTLAENAIMNVTVTSPLTNDKYLPELQTGISGIVTGTYNTKAGSVTNITVTGHPINDDSGYGGTVGLDIYGKSTLTGDLNVKVLSPKGIGLRMDSDNYAGYTSQMILNGNVDVQTNDGYAILSVSGASDAGEVVINKNGGHTVKLLGNIDTRGDDRQLIDVTLDNGASYLTGTVKMSGTNVDNETNLNFANSSTWNETGDSVVTNLTNNNSLINMTKGADTLSAVTYDGSGGTLYMDTDLNSETDGDKFNIGTTTTTAGETKIQIRDASLLNKTEVTGVKNLLLVTDGTDTTTQGTATFVGESLNAGGLWDVTPTVVNGLNALDAAGNPVGTANEWYLTKVEKKFNPDTEVLIDTGNMAYSFYRNVLTDDSLRKRLGDLRFTGEDQGLWARMKTGKLTGAGSASYQMYQVGYDKKAGNTYYGLAVDHNRSTNSFDNGNGENTMTNLSLYATNYHKSGAYSDFVLKAGKLHGDTNSFGPYPDEGSYSGWGFSGSYELGKTFAKDNGFFIEPQAQLSLGYVRGYDYTTDRGTKISVDANKAVVGRLGAVMGRRTDVGDYYFSANLFHDFAGRITGDLLAANGERGSIDGDLGYTWYELGIGGNYKLSKKTYVYGDIVKSFNGTVQKRWQANAGVRWAF